MNVTTRISRLIPVAALSATLLLAACNSGRGAASGSESGSLRRSFMFALPRVEVRIDRKGMPSIGGITPALLERLSLGAVHADSFRVDNAWIDYFISTNVQHIELLQNDSGMYVWVNGRRMPNVTYTARELDNLSALAESARALQMLGLSDNRASLVQRAVPLLGRFGLNLLVRFPANSGADAIATRSVRERATPAARVAKRDASGSVEIGLRYDERGDPWLDGLTDQEFAEVFGVDVMTLALEPAFVADIGRRGIHEIAVRSEADDLALSINNQALPAMQCDLACLNDLGEVLSILNTYPETEYLNESMRAMLPTLRDIDAHFVLRFPATSANAARAAGEAGN